jgi:hypothetical protein
MDKLNEALEKLKENKTAENMNNIIDMIKINIDKKIIDSFTDVVIKEKYFDNVTFTLPIISLYLNSIKIDFILEYIFKIIEKSSSYNNKYLFMYHLLKNEYKLTQDQFNKYIHILIESTSGYKFIKSDSNDIVHRLNMNNIKNLLKYTSDLNMDSILELYTLDIMDIDSEIIDIIYKSPHKIIETLIQTNNKNKFVKILFGSKIINKFLADFDIKNNLEFIVYLTSNDCSLYFLKENISNINISLICDSIKKNIYKYKSNLTFDFLLNEVQLYFDTKDLENICSVFFDNFNDNDTNENCFYIIYSLLNHKISPTSQCIKNLIDNFENHRKKLIEFLNGQDIVHWYRQQKIETENKKIKYILDIINIFENFGYIMTYEDFYYLTKYKITLENIEKYNFDLNDKIFQEICAENLFFPYNMKLKQEYFYLVFKNKLLFQDILKLSNKFNLKPDILCLETLCKTNPRPNLIKTLLVKYNLKLSNDFIDNLPNSSIKKILQSL